MWEKSKNQKIILSFQLDLLKKKSRHATKKSENNKFDFL